MPTEPGIRHSKKARNPKSEIAVFQTNPNDLNPNDQNENSRLGRRIAFVLNFEFLNFEFVSNFVLQEACFGFII